MTLVHDKIQVSPESPSAEGRSEHDCLKGLVLPPPPFSMSGWENGCLTPEGFKPKRKDLQRVFGASTQLNLLHLSCGHVTVQGHFYPIYISNLYFLLVKKTLGLNFDIEPSLKNSNKKYFN